MNLFFEESGDFRTGSILAQAGEAYQVELPGGKRTKVRARDVLFRYETGDPAQFMSDAQAVEAEIDLDFLWEVAGEEEFSFAELGAEYFGHEPRPHEAAGLLLRLHGAPMYFYRKGRGRYKAAPEKSLKAALAGLEKKRMQAVIQQQYVEQMQSGIFPAAMKPLAMQLLCKPDKNSMEYKALSEACMVLQTTPERLMLQTGAIASPYDLHFSRFLFEYFPKGTAFPPGGKAVSLPDLPAARVEAFSIDDVTTTEIDDAFSVTRLPDGTVQVGIHIAVPALGIAPGDEMDALAYRRMSTVYMPGDKITMLPDEYVQVFTLGAGEKRPAVSLYATIDPVDNRLVGTETRLECIQVSVNLRHNDLDRVVTEENLSKGQGDYPHKDDIQVLWQWTQALEAARMAKRESFGLSPKQIHYPDYNFYIQDGRVAIEPRLRTAPLDRIVAELMIFANSTWGRMMQDCGVPGIFRCQGGDSRASRLVRQLVRMQTHAAPHQGLGVDQYAWSTSPLRRYTDLVNQWQILSCIRDGVAAPLSAPFKPRDARLFAIIGAFESAYTAYGDFQARMERYWCLRWLSQNGISQARAVVARDEMVRLQDIPLTISLPAARTLPNGTEVMVDLLRQDEVDLSVEARLAEVLTAVPAAEMGPEGGGSE
ncbi:MAG: RNB domain-containing ribonuclease [Alistipes senegalensis]|nr:RNB domain-containing ribonuclease [Oxalobacter formigenes]MCM1280660.1 RNB domain-containing ribonuclease [Alistipes senegalensis]